MNLKKENPLDSKELLNFLIEYFSYGLINKFIEIQEIESMHNDNIQFSQFIEYNKPDHDKERHQKYYNNFLKINKIKDEKRAKYSGQIISDEIIREIKKITIDKEHTRLLINDYADRYRKLKNLINAIELKKPEGQKSKKYPMHLIMSDILGDTTLSALDEYKKFSEVMTEDPTHNVIYEYDTTCISRIIEEIMEYYEQHEMLPMKINDKTFLFVYCVIDCAIKYFNKGERFNLSNISWIPKVTIDESGYINSIDYTFEESMGLKYKKEYISSGISILDNREINISLLYGIVLSCMPESYILTKEEKQIKSALDISAGYSFKQVNPILEYYYIEMRKKIKTIENIKTIDNIKTIKIESDELNNISNEIWIKLNKILESEHNHILEYIYEEEHNEEEHIRDGGEYEVIKTDSDDQGDNKKEIQIEKNQKAKIPKKENRKKEEISKDGSSPWKSTIYFVFIILFIVSFLIILTNILIKVFDIFEKYAKQQKQYINN